MTININDNLRISEINEQTLITYLIPKVSKSKYISLGPSDDAAILNTLNSKIVLSIDTQIEDIDFRLHWKNGMKSNAYDIGWKSIAQGVSDIAAMGCIPTSIFLSLALPNYLKIKWIKNMLCGMYDFIRSFNLQDCFLAGGDLTKGSEKIFISTTITGMTKHRIVKRIGANIGDKLYLLGNNLGKAAAGLSLLESNISYLKVSDELNNLVYHNLRPTPPLFYGIQASKLGASSMIDISDGLISNVTQIADINNVSIEINGLIIEKLISRPMFEAANLLKRSAINWIFNGGEDYNLVCTFPSTLKLPKEYLYIGKVIERAQTSLRISNIKI